MRQNKYPHLKFKDLSEGQLYKTQNSGFYIILNIETPNNILIEFLETGYQKTTKMGYIKTGSIRDKRLPSHHGVGYLDDINTSHYLKEYNHWKMMMGRCYNPNYHAYHLYGGNGVTVDKRWHSFKNFVEDFKKIDGYSEEIMELTRERQLDKDIKQQHIPLNQRVYSLETCTLTHSDINQKYKRYSKPTVKFIATTPEGEEIYAENVRQWCKNNKHGQKYIDLCFTGKIDTYRGWKFRKITEEEYQQHLDEKTQFK